MKRGWGVFLEGTGPSSSMTFAAACLRYFRTTGHIGQCFLDLVLYPGVSAGVV